MQSSKPHRFARLRFPVAALIAAASLACRFAPQPTPTPNLLEALLQSRPTDTPSPSAVPTPGISDCPIPPGSPELPEPSHLAGLPAAIQAYLSQGGSPEALQAHLERAGWSPRAETAISRADFDGDRLQDVALSLQDPTADALQAPGTLLIFVCTTDGLELNYAANVDQDSGAPIILAARDLNADGAADLLIGREACGAHTCQQSLQILIWQGASFEDRLRGSSIDLPSPRLDLARPRADGPYAISVTATGIQSVGAGPFRQLTRTWTWDEAEGAFVVTAEVQEEPSFRVHALHEADQAARREDLTGALDLYRQVMESPDLRDWVAPIEERAILGAYAGFRHVVLLSRLERRDQAASMLQSIGALYPPGSAGHAYVALAQSFWDAYLQAGSIDHACSIARDYAAAHRREILDPLYFGYANPTYTAEDVCP